MTRTIFWTVALLLVLISALPPHPAAAQEEDLDALGAGSDAVLLPEDVTVIRDLAYGSHPAQTMDVYLPPHPENAPVLMMVHGGAWRIGDKSEPGVVVNKVAHWLPKGYIFISVNNRLLPDADPLEQADDVAKALAVAQAKAKALGGDPARFVLMGHSAGAHLVTLLAADPAIAARQGAKPWIATVALDAGAYDIVSIMKRRHDAFFDDAFGSDPAFWRKASPLYRLNRTPAPLFLVCSSLGRESCRQAWRFADAVTGAGGTATVHGVAMRHMPINAALGLPGDYTDAVDQVLASLGLP
jgi:arylformamidase